MNGRAYFAAAAKELGLSELDSVQIEQLAPPPGLKPGKRESKVGGWIAKNVRHLTSSETAERQERSERFLKQPDLEFPAEEVPPTQDVPK